MTTSMTTIISMITKRVHMLGMAMKIMMIMAMGNMKNMTIIRNRQVLMEGE
jgi:hypothetical protein